MSVPHADRDHSEQPILASLPDDPNIDPPSWHEGAWTCEADVFARVDPAEEAAQEIALLKDQVARLRSRNRKLINGILPLQSECPAPGGCGNCALCHRDVARALVNDYSKNLHAANVDMSPHGVRLLRARAEKAEAALDRVRALADSWTAEAEGYRNYSVRSSNPDSLRGVARTLAMVADEARAAIEGES